MTRRPPKKATVAARALEAAIAEETAEIRAELSSAQATIRNLKATLTEIASTAYDAVAVAALNQPEPEEPAVLPPAIASMLEAARAPRGPDTHEESPAGSLSGDDDMGHGRWV